MTSNNTLPNYGQTMKHKAWIISENAAGMLEQAKGLAEGLNLDYDHAEISLSFPWKHIPPKLTPIRSWVTNRTFSTGSIPPVVISCGRKSVVPALTLKKLKPQTVCIHILNPYINTSYFDWVIAPQHDQISGNNVIETVGSVHYLTQEKILKHKGHLNKQINSQKKTIAFFIGGPNNCYNLNESIITELTYTIYKSFNQSEYQLLFIPSRRTPKSVIEWLAKNIRPNDFLGSETCREDYLSALAWADKIIITSDSVCMISESASTGKPIFIATLPKIRKNHRFERFHQSMQAEGITRPLGNATDYWQYKPINDIEHIINQLKQSLRL